MESRCNKCEYLSECKEVLDIYGTNFQLLGSICKKDRDNAENDVVKNPSHYCFSKYQPKDVIRAWNLNFNLGNCIKYVARAGRKDNIIQDLKKAKQYLEFEIEFLEKTLEEQ